MIARTRFLIDVKPHTPDRDARAAPAQSANHVNDLPPHPIRFISTHITHSDHKRSRVIASRCLTIREPHAISVCSTTAELWLWCVVVHCSHAQSSSEARRVGETPETIPTSLHQTAIETGRALAPPQSSSAIEHELSAQCGKDAALPWNRERQSVTSETINSIHLDSPACHTCLEYRH